jgi:hypothetical protein
MSRKLCDCIALLTSDESSLVFVSLSLIHLIKGLSFSDFVLENIQFNIFPLVNLDKHLFITGLQNSFNSPDWRKQTEYSD